MFPYSWLFTLGIYAILNYYPSNNELLTHLYKERNRYPILFNDYRSNSWNNDESIPCIDFLDQLSAPINSPVEV